MSQRRMFTQKITESGAFLEMPLSAQALYFHLCMAGADDDGFVSNPKFIARMIGASDDDFKLLLAKNFVIAYERGVIVIKHWRMHNLIRNDRYQPTEYTEEKAMLYIKDNGAYTLDSTQGAPLMEVDGNRMATKRQPNGNQMATEDRIGKDRLIEDKKDIEVVKQTSPTKKKYGQYKHVLLTDDEYAKLHADFTNADEAITFLDEYIEMKGYKAKSHYLCIRKWVIDALKERETKKQRSSGVTKSAQAYNSYQQRNYSSQDMNDIEAMLLAKSREKAGRV